MYHIFIAVTLMVSQDFLRQEVVDYATKKEEPQIKPTKLVKEELTNQEQIAKNDVKEEHDSDFAAQSQDATIQTPAEQNISSDFASQRDVIAVLKEEEKRREEELNKLAQEDIESLGLDAVEDNQTDFGTKVKPNIEDNTINEEGFSTVANKKVEKEEVAEDKKEENIEANTPIEKSEENIEVVENIPLPILEIKKSQIEKSEKKSVTEDLKQDNSATQEQEELAKEDSKKDSSNVEEKDIGVIKTVSKSLSKVKDKIAKTLGVGEEKKEESTIQEAKEEPEEEKLTQEEKEEIKAKRLEKRRIERLKQQKEEKRQRKLAKLREEYIEKFNYDLEGSINKNYIIPPKKVLPKFINYPVPPSLLERPKSYENRHHPDIMTYRESVDLAFEAVKKNEFNNFKALYEVIKDFGSNPNIKNSKGNTLLIYSILMQKHEIVAFLLTNGANPNLTNNLGYTPLNVAIEMADYISVELLVKAGADIGFTDNFGMNYLMQAVNVGYFPVIDFLVEKGMDVNIVDDNGFSALDIAYRQKKEVIIKYLKKYGAKTWVKKDYAPKKPLIDQLETRWQYNKQP